MYYCLSLYPLYLKGHESDKRYFICSSVFCDFRIGTVFSISLLAIGYSSFEVLTYRWGVATVVLLVFAFLTKCDFHIGYKDFKTIFGLSLLRALTSFSLVIAYQNIASGVASIIHFMYPLAVAVTMAVFFREKSLL